VDSSTRFLAHDDLDDRVIHRSDTRLYEGKSQELHSQLQLVVGWCIFSFVVRARGLIAWQDMARAAA
jgi:hypothetical protein